jgi:hypothetical protein
MLKCVLLSLVLLATVFSLPLEIETEESVTDQTATEPVDVETEETAHSQLAEDEKENKEILDRGKELNIGSDQNLEEHIFILDYDSDENVPSEIESNDIEETVMERKLEQPNTRNCAQSKLNWLKQLHSLILFLGPSHFTHRGHSYWFSGDEADYAGTKADWLEARNICRIYCMDLVSIETPA